MVNFFKVVFLIAIAGLISACAISKSIKLAVDCQTDEALQVIDEAAKGGGLTAEIAKLEREAVLRDAGRIDEAESDYRRESGEAVRLAASLMNHRDGGRSSLGIASGSLQPAGLHHRIAR